MLASTIFDPFKISLDNKSPKTAKAYLVSLHGFAAWLETQPGGMPFEPDKITRAAIISYLDHLTQNGRSVHTRRLVITALRKYCAWAVSASLLPHNPARQIAMPTVGTMSPRELSDDQRFALKTQVERTNSTRLAAIFALGYWTGLRISEIADLALDNISLNQRAGQVSIVNSKGGKSRHLDLHNESRRALSIYLDSSERDSDSPFVFTSQRAAWLRTQGKPDNLSVRGIDHVWNTFKASVPHDIHLLIHDVTMHDLRHDFAHRARHAGWKLEEIAVYLGHQTKAGTPAIATTVRYTLPNRQQLKRQLQRLPG